MFTIYQKQRFISSACIVVSSILIFFALHDLLWRIALIIMALMLLNYALRLRGQSFMNIGMRWMNRRF